jgi:hypothetical protein
MVPPAARVVRGNLFTPPSTLVFGSQPLVVATADGARLTHLEFNAWVKAGDSLAYWETRIDNAVTDAGLLHFPAGQVLGFVAPEGFDELLILSSTVDSEVLAMAAMGFGPDRIVLGQGDFAGLFLDVDNVPPRSPWTSTATIVSAYSTTAPRSSIPISRTATRTGRVTPATGFRMVVVPSRSASSGSTPFWPILAFRTRTTMARATLPTPVREQRTAPKSMLQVAPCSSSAPGSM